MIKSLLFIPGNREKMLNKAEKSEADAVIFDLEDSIVESEKKRARMILSDFLYAFENNSSKKIIVRTNAERELLKDDIVSTVKSNMVDSYMIPKATVSMLEVIEELLEELPGGDNITLIPMIESPEGILDMRDIMKASPRITGALFGAEDYTTQMGLKRTVEGEEIVVARNLFAITCRASGIEAYDTPFVDVRNEDGLLRDAEKGKAMGMTGKAAIHPKQIETINRVYRYTEDEIRKARMIVKESEAAKEKGLGAFSLDGEMIDLPVIIRAQKLLESIDADENL